MIAFYVSRKFYETFSRFRYQKEPKPSASMTSHMKYLVSQVKPLELKYRLCSQLNFKDILHSIIINPDVALLKDTVWQVGYKQKGGLKWK
jgi:hypothetical protein